MGPSTLTTIIEVNPIVSAIKNGGDPTAGARKQIEETTQDYINGQIEIGDKIAEVVMKYEENEEKDKDVKFDSETKIEIKSKKSGKKVIVEIFNKDVMDQKADALMETNE